MEFILEQIKEGDKAPIVIELDKEEIIIDRTTIDSLSNIPLISNVNISLQKSVNNQWFVKDMTCSGGVYVNGNKIGRSLYGLKVGDVLSFGHSDDNQFGAVKLCLKIKTSCGNTDTAAKMKNSHSKGCEDSNSSQAEEVSVAKKLPQKKRSSLKAKCKKMKCKDVKKSMKHNILEKEMTDIGDAADQLLLFEDKYDLIKLRRRQKNLESNNPALNVSKPEATSSSKAFRSKKNVSRQRSMQITYTLNTQRYQRLVKQFQKRQLIVSLIRCDSQFFKLPKISNEVDLTEKKERVRKGSKKRQKAKSKKQALESSKVTKKQTTKLNQCLSEEDDIRPLKKSKICVLSESDSVDSEDMRANSQIDGKINFFTDTSFVKPQMHNNDIEMKGYSQDEKMMTISSDENTYLDFKTCQNIGTPSVNSELFDSSTENLEDILSYIQSPESPDSTPKNRRHSKPQSLERKSPSKTAYKKNVNLIRECGLSTTSEESSSSSTSLSDEETTDSTNEAEQSNKKKPTRKILLNDPKPLQIQSSYKYGKEKCTVKPFKKIASQVSRRKKSSRLRQREHVQNPAVSLKCSTLQNTEAQGSLRKSSRNHWQKKSQVTTSESEVENEERIMYPSKNAILKTEKLNKSKFFLGEKSIESESESEFVKQMRPIRKALLDTKPLEFQPHYKCEREEFIEKSMKDDTEVSQTPVPRLQNSVASCSKVQPCVQKFSFHQSPKLNLQASGKKGSAFTANKEIEIPKKCATVKAGPENYGSRMLCFIPENISEKSSSTAQNKSQVAVKESAISCECQNEHEHSACEAVPQRPKRVITYAQYALTRKKDVQTAVVLPLRANTSKPVSAPQVPIPNRRDPRKALYLHTSKTANATKSEAPLAQDHTSKKFNFQFIMSKVLTWNTVWLQQQIEREKYKPPPDISNGVLPLKLCFSSIQDYSESFLPMIFLELWELIFREWKISNYIKKEGKIFNFLVKACRFKNGLMILNCETVINTKTSYQPEDGHLLVVYLIDQAKNKQISVFSYITDITVQVMDKISLNPVWRIAPNLNLDEAKIFAFTLTIKKRELFFPEDTLLEANSLCYVYHKMKVANSLQYLNFSPLGEYILKPRLEIFNIPVKKPNQPLQIVGYDAGQSEIIRAVIEDCRMSYAAPKIFLLSGSTGTGKTHTILGIIKHLVQITDYNMKILLVAPTSDGIDRIGCRILDLNRELGGNKNWKPLNFARIGESEHQEIKPYLLKQLALKSFKKCIEHDDLSLGEQIKSLQDELKKAIQEKNELKINSLSSSELTVKQSFIDNREKQVNSLKEVQMKNSNKTFNPYLEKRYKIKVLREADVVLAVLRDSTKDIIKNVFGPKSDVHFSYCIVDDATHVSEPEIIQTLTYSVHKLILVGDVDNSRASVRSKLAEECNFKRSLSERLKLYCGEQYKVDPCFTLTEKM